MYINTGSDRAFTKETVKKDVIVVGAGPAGISAALAAARRGATVALVTDRPVLGGSCSSEVRIGPGGAAAHGQNRFSRETGLFEEMLLNLQYRAHLAGKWRWSDWDEIFFDMVMGEENIELYLNTTVVSADRDGQAIKSCMALLLRGEKEYTFEGDSFIDCSGDGTLGFLAGAESRIGREGKSEFNEPRAPEKADLKTMGHTLLFTTKKATHPVPYEAPSWAIDVSRLKAFHGDEKFKTRRRYRLDDGTFFGFWWCEYGGDIDSIHDDREINLHLRKLAYGTWDYIKNSGEFDDVEDQVLNWICYLPGKRESRRLIGPHIVTANDFIDQRRFDDSIGFTGWSLDVHPPKGYLDERPGAEHIKLPGITDIPYRALYSKNIGNLLFAGRDISCTHQALGTLRLICTSGVMGQAVGIAAAMASEKGVGPHAIYEDHLDEFRTALARTDQSLIGYELKEPEDLSRSAKVTASSFRKPALEKRNAFHRIDDRLMLVHPVDGRPFSKISFYLNSHEERTLKVRFYSCVPKVTNYRIDTCLHTVETRIDGEGWITLELPREIADRADWTGRKLFIIIEPDEKLFLGVSHDTMAGFIMGTMDNETEPRWESELKRLPLLPCMKSDAGERFFAPENIKNGHIRTYGLPMLWESERFQFPDPQWIEYNLSGTGQSQKVSRVELVFNSELDRRGFVPIIRSLNPGIAKKYRITGTPGVGTPAAGDDNEGERITLITEENNYQRFRVHTFDTAELKDIRLEVYESWNSDYAEVYDFRVYEK